ncbi:unnamed protein product [Lymnaea stagnalis]|uniref:RPA-interacting protein C-terminal domain-containing protein n=1 Tax=Lymnaea stagnalis TaxID=6523 RepID=A0AAV2H639_LYMST
MSKERTFEAGITRQDMYKLRTPPWKETYRKRCIERLRANRAKAHSLKRRLGLEEITDEESNVYGIADPSQNPGILLDIEAIMEEEWRKMDIEGVRQNRADTEGNAGDGGQFFDDMLRLYDDINDEIRREIQADLRNEEQRILCDRYLQEEEDELCSALKTLSTDDVICPLCQKYILLENKGVIFCNCGLRISTEQDCVTLKNVRSNILEGTAEHSENCEAHPKFQVSQKFGISNLLMSCETCDFLFIIV